MFSCNDSWFMNEPPSFYISTDTIDNPIFDAQSGDQIPAKDQEGVRRNEVGKIASSSNKQPSAASYGSGLIFAIQNKMFVLELNLRRGLRSIKRFTIKHLNEVYSLFSCITGNSTNKQSSSRLKKDLRFWQEVEPNPELLSSQKEKILFRLEQVLQAKRSKEQRLFNMNQLEEERNWKEETSRNNRLLKGKTISKTTKRRARTIISELSPKFYGSHKKKTKGRTIGCKSNRKVLPTRRIRDVSSNYKKNYCAICYTNSPNIVTLPCKHNEICSDCFIEIIYIALKQSRFPLKCVICRQKIEKIQCSKRLLLNVIEKNRFSY